MTSWAYNRSLFELKAPTATQLLGDSHAKRPAGQQKNQPCGQEQLTLPTGGALLPHRSKQWVWQSGDGLRLSI